MNNFPLVNNSPMNHLGHEKSPYLLQHKDNPVEWHPWGEEAFLKAQAEDKPIFLSIGYSTCHWCHVMAHESFEDSKIAQLMNDYFVNIKVDREERPDVDRVYMAFVQATTGSGGWPMSVWLTPDGHPFYGGTYFPPDDRYGRAGFPKILSQIAKLWEANRDGIKTRAARVLDALRESTNAPSVPGELDVSWIRRGQEAFAQAYDPVHGGFGGAPKFPRPATLNFLLRGDDRSRGMALNTLRAMSQGGMRDQLGGGFHRYSVDDSWHVPHFEKMLYDQGQITTSLVEAWQITGDPFFREIASTTLDYVLGEMTHPAGGFFSAEDADSLIEHGHPEHAEGAFYVWRKSDIMHLLDPEDAKIFCHHYGVEENGNAPEGSDPQGEFAGKNILIERCTISDTARFLGLTEEDTLQSLAASRRKLFEHRAARPRPHRDDKILTAWNGLMISAFAKAGAVFDKPLYLTAAKRAADFILSHLMQDGALLRSWRDTPSKISGFAEDYAFFIQSLLDLYQADLELRWIRTAIALQKEQDRLFWDEQIGSYFSSAAADPLVPIRMKEDYDGAEPSANSISALNLLRLARLFHDGDLEKRAMRILSVHAMQMERMPSAVPQMLVALDFALKSPSQAVLVGSRNDIKKFLYPLQRAFRPYTVILLLDDESREFFTENIPLLSNMLPASGKATLYLCENFTCQSPITETNELVKYLKQEC